MKPLLLALALLPLPALAAPVGTYTTSQWYETIYDTKGRAVYLQVHYPAVSSAYGANADPSQGSFPLLAFMHGFAGQAWMYNGACDAFASMGFVVVNLDTETDPVFGPDTDALASDARTALNWANDSSHNPQHWLADMVSDADWTAMGHSMGGIALARLVSIEPRIHTIVGFNPYESTGDEYAAYGDFKGSALMFGGTDDTTATPAMVHDWFDALTAPNRSLFLLTEGGGHGAIEDLNWGGDGALEEDVQLQSDIAFTEAFLQSEVFGNEGRWRDLVCDPVVPIRTTESDGFNPLVAPVVNSPSEVAFTLAGRRGATAGVYAGTGPGTTDVGVDLGLKDAVEIARVPMPDGVACPVVTLPADLAGIAWVQVVFERDEGAILGHVLDLYGAEDTPVEDEEGPIAKEDEAASCGCASAPSPSAVALLALLALVCRRKSGI